MRQIRPSQVPYLTSVLWRTQRMMNSRAYLEEHEATRPAPGILSAAPAPACAGSGEKEG
jgi:hypothetical protein